MELECRALSLRSVVGGQWEFQTIYHVLLSFHVVASLCSVTGSGFFHHLVTYEIPFHPEYSAFSI